MNLSCWCLHKHYLLPSLPLDCPLYLLVTADTVSIRPIKATGLDRIHIIVILDTAHLPRVVSGIFKNTSKYQFILQVDLSEYWGNSPEGLNLNGSQKVWEILLQSCISHQSLLVKLLEMIGEQWYMVQMCYLKLMLDSTSPMPYLHFHTHNEETDLIIKFCEDDEYDHVLIMKRKCEAINFGCRTQRKL